MMILIVWSGTGRQVDLYLKETNTMHKDIKEKDYQLLGLNTNSEE